MTMNQKSLESNLYEEIKDYRIFKEGDNFTPLNKKIHILIVVEITYIVFLDEQLRVHWHYNDDYFNDEYPKFDEACGKVLGRQAHLEALSGLLLKDSHREAPQRMLAEAIARLLDDRKVDYANLLLDKAARFVEARSHERARGWYLWATLPTTLISLIFGLIFWINRQTILALLDFEPGAADIFLGAAMGSLGASISVLLRSDRLKLDPLAGRGVHSFEGVIRILVGAFAGMLFILAVKSNILLGTINQSANPRTILLTLSIVAGASEALLPSLINQISATLIGGIKPAQVPGKDEESLSDEAEGEDSVHHEQGCEDQENRNHILKKQAHR
jgi:hypothetical protein